MKFQLQNVLVKIKYIGGGLIAFKCPRKLGKKESDVIGI